MCFMWLMFFRLVMFLCWVLSMMANSAMPPDGGVTIHDTHPRMHLPFSVLFRESRSSVGRQWKILFESFHSRVTDLDVLGRSRCCLGHHVVVDFYFQL